MFADYVYKSTDSNPLVSGGGEVADEFSTVLPPHLFPQFEQPVLWSKGSNSSGHLEEDFVMIAEFSEIEGPRPLILIPFEGGQNMDLNHFVLKIMAVDNQVSSQNFTICQDWQVVNTDREEGIYAFVHHVILNDIQARGYVRPFCIAYVTSTERKIMNFFKEISESFHKVARSLKYGNRLVFMRDLENYVLDLEHTEKHMRKSSPNSSGQSAGEEGNVEELAEADDPSAVQTALKEVKEILSVVKALQHDQRLETRFQTLEVRAWERTCSHHSCVTETFSLPEKDASRDRPSDLPLRASSQGDDSEGSMLLFDKSQKHVPCLVDLQRQKKFDDPLRSFNDLCSWGAKEGVKKLRCIQEHFRKELLYLELERSEYELLDPSPSLLSCGQCITANFLSGVSMRELPLMRHCPSLDTLDSYKSVASFLSAHSYDSLASAHSYSGLNIEDPELTRYDNGGTLYTPSQSPRKALEGEIPDLRGMIIQPLRPHADSAGSETMSRLRSVSQNKADLASLEARLCTQPRPRDDGTEADRQPGEGIRRARLAEPADLESSGTSTTESTFYDGESQTSSKESGASDGGSVNPIKLTKTLSRFPARDPSRCSLHPVTASADSNGSTEAVPERHFGNTIASSFVDTEGSSVDGTVVGSLPCYSEQSGIGRDSETDDDAGATDPNVFTPSTQKHTSMLSKTIKEMGNEDSLLSSSSSTNRSSSWKSELVNPRREDHRHIQAQSKTEMQDGNEIRPATVSEEVDALSQESQDSHRTLSVSSREASGSCVVLPFNSHVGQPGQVGSPGDSRQVEMRRMNSGGKGQKEEGLSSLSLSSSMDVTGSPHLGARYPGFQGGPWADTPTSPRTSSCSSPTKKSRCGVYSMGDLLFNFSLQSPGGGLLWMLSAYNGLQHAIHSLMTGRPLLVVGPPTHENEVVQLVTALSAFLPDCRRKGPSVVEWLSKPLRITDLCRLKLVGVCRPNRRSLEGVIPRIVRKYSSMIDVEKKIIVAPVYEGTQINNIISKRKNLKSETELIALIHCWLMELSSKAFIFYHSFCLGSAGSMHHHGGLMQHQQQYQSTVRSLMMKLGIHPGDMQIIEYLTEIVKMSQAESFQRQNLEPGSFVTPLFLSYKPCQTFKCSA